MDPDWELLSIERTYAALEAAIAARDLTLVEVVTEDAWRVSGLPETGRDLWFVTNVRSAAGGSVAFECLLPVSIPLTQLAAVLELCLWLSSEGRIRYSVDRSRPYASLDVTLLAACADQAPAMIGAALDLLWARVAAYESAFHGVAAGVGVEAAIAALEDKSMAEVIRDKPWSSVP